MAAKSHYDYIVVGLGGIGSATLYHLSRKVGKNVLGIEQFNLGHDNGGSQDHSRIIRNQYNDKIFCNLTPHTYTAWEQLERESGIQLVYKTGSLSIAKQHTSGELMTEKDATAMSECNIPYERWDARKLRSRYPQWRVDDNVVCLYQRDGGIVDAARGNALHIQMARGHGASILENCAVNNLVTHDDGTAEVHTTHGKFTCNKVIVTAGAWINQVLGCVGVHIPVVVTQEQVTYFGTPHTKLFTKDNFPVFLYHDEDNDFYGMPIHGNTGFKIGIDAAGPSVSPNTRTYVPDLLREQRCVNFLQEMLPQSLGPILYTKTCLYTMTLDRTFVIDTLAKQGKPQIVVCAGAGHAFKFAGLFGQILTDLATEGWTAHDLSPFTMDREAVRNPNYPPDFHLGKATTSSKI